MNVLVISAHPDDEVLGVGGTILKHTSQGDDVFLLMVTEGASTQYKDNVEMIEQKKRELDRVKEILGIKEIIFLDFPDMKLDTLPKVEINAAVAKVVQLIKPKWIYTHFYGDINSDHQAVFEATLVASRPVNQNSVEKLLCYYTPSSTEWNIQEADTVFKPNVYVDISDFLEQKKLALACYESELRPYPHPRSIEAIDIHAKYWGTHVGLKAAEPFVLVREILI